MCVFLRYRTEIDAIMARWKRLGSTLTDNAQRIQELMAKLMQFEVPLITTRHYIHPSIIHLHFNPSSSLSLSPPERRQDFEEVDGRRGRVLKRGVACTWRL